MARFAEIDRVHQGLLSIRRAIDRWRSLPPILRSAPGDGWAACLSAHLIVRSVAFGDQHAPESTPGKRVAPRPGRRLCGNGER
jgi:hypothetical protein